MVSALAHVCIFARDLERSRWFYVDVLGLEIAFRFVKEGELFGYYFRLGERQFLEVFRREEAPAEAPHPIAHFTLETPDIRALRATLVEAGIEASEPRLGADQSWQMWLADPDGTRIEIHQYTPQSTQFTGKDCVVDW
ncbi:MAG: VOC family protein [Verrucomicrobiota bacterium]